MPEYLFNSDEATLSLPPDPKITTDSVTEYITTEAEQAMKLDIPYELPSGRRG